jgi:hypothetical protein
MTIHDLKAHVAHLEDRVDHYRHMALKLQDLADTLEAHIGALRAERDQWQKTALDYQDLFRRSLGLHDDRYRDE